MAINTSYRTSASEIMDDFELEGEVLKDALDKIARINQLIPPGTKVQLDTIKDKKEKYGRYLGIIYLNKLNIAVQLINEGLAVQQYYN